MAKPGTDSLLWLSSIWGGFWGTNYSKLKKHPDFNYTWKYYEKTSESEGCLYYRDESNAMIPKKSIKILMWDLTYLKQERNQTCLTMMTCLLKIF